MKNLIVCIFFAISLASFGQPKILTKNLDQAGVINHMVFDNSESAYSMEKAKQLLHDSLKLTKQDDLILVSETTDDLGFTRQIYMQYYNGIKVENGIYSVNGKKGQVYYISGEFKKLQNVNIVPVLSEAEALQKTCTYIKAIKYRWQISSEESNIKIDKKDSSATYYPKGELIICKDVIKTDSLYRLAYKFDIFAVEPLSHQIYYTDAITGELLNTVNLIMDSNTNATATSLYRGQVQITTDSYNGSYRLYETRSSNNVPIHTFNANNSSTIPPTNYYEITNSSTTWPSSSAIDAHWGMEKVYDFWKASPRNWNSINNQGMAINGYAHFSSGAGADNAYWDGSEMLYGDGYSVFNPVVSIDVIAHEIGHGIMQYTAGFNGNRENPSLNEGFSDIWASVVEHWVASDATNNWLIGEQIMKNGKTCLRSLRNPKYEGFNTWTNTYPGGFPNTYTGTYWINPSGCTTPSQSNDYCYCHTNLTVLTYWFYLLSIGNSSTNDLGHAYAVFGLGIDAAAKIVWQAQRYNLYSHPSAQFSDVMTQTIQSATDLYGANSLEVMQVRNAWYAVGFGSLPSQMTITGNTLLCSTGSYTVNNVPSGCSVKWTNKSSNITLPQNTNVNPITVTANGNGAGWLEARVLSSSTDSVTIRYNIWVGPPSVTVTGDATSDCTYTTHYFTATQTDYNSSPTSFSWNLVPLNGNTVSPYGYQNSQCAITFYNPYSASGYTVQARATNSCGTGSYGSTSIYIHNCLKFSLSPNPASGTVTVSKEIFGASDSESRAAVSEDATTVYTIRILNYYGSLQYTTTRSGDSFTIPVSNLKDGRYIIQFSNGKEVYNSQLIVKH